MLNIRDATEKDIKIVKLLEDRAFLQDAYDVDMLLTAILESDGMSVIAEFDGEPAGYSIAIGMANRKADIESICVDPEFRGKGIGMMLLSSIEQKMKERGFTESVLEVREHNRSAIAMYEKAGYILVKRLTNFYEGELEGSRDAIRMKKSLR